MRMRKKKHTADRMTSLSDLFVQNGDNIPDFSEIFGNVAPLRLEIGCGKGDFVRQLSVRDSGYNYIAMEKIDDVIVIAAEKYAASRGLGSLAPNGGWKKWDGETVPMGEKVLIPDGMRGNVRFMRADAADIGKIFPEGSVDSVYANFSDPWTKAGYASRRLTHANFLAMYETILVPGGAFFFKTDNAELFEFSVESVKNSPLSLEFVTDDLHSSERVADNIMTEYEKNFVSKGMKIHMLEARKA